MKKRGIAGLILFISLMIIPAVSAEILMGQIGTLYSKGDDFKIDLTLSPSVDTRGFLEASLMCYSVASDVDVDALIASRSSANDLNNTNETDSTDTNQSVSDAVQNSEISGEIQIYKSPQTVRKGERKVITISTTLDSYFLGDLAGDCLIRAKFGNDITDSQVFGISSAISVEFDLGGFAFNPGDTINISGTAIKKNGIPLEGFLSLSIVGLGINASGVSSTGQFTIGVNLPQNAVAGEYPLNIKAYEKDDFGDVTNEGTASQTMRVNQVVREVGLALNSQTIIPGEDLVYTVLLFDQAGNEATEDVGIKIYDEQDNVVTEGVVKSSIAGSFTVGQNFSSGYWTIEASNSEHKIRKAFLVSELEKVSYVLTNDTITVTNVGNVLYDKPIELALGETKIVKNVRLSVGESVVFQLEAPAGDYDISAGDGESTENLGVASLTGKAISISEFGSIEWFGGTMLWIWGVLFLVILIIVALIYIRHRKKNYSSGASGASGASSGMNSSGFGGTGNAGKNALENISSGDISGGNKEEASIVALKIKNLGQIVGTGGSGEGSATGTIENVLLSAKNMGAKIYIDGDYRLAIFSQILTKEADNSITAIKTAQEVFSLLNNHNSRFAQKISFGIGVHNGDMIVESQNGKFKFTSLGNSIGNAKKVASESSGEVLMSEELHRKTVGKVKSAKMPTGSFWRVREVIDREKYSGFVSKVNKESGNSSGNSPGNSGNFKDFRGVRR